MHVVSWVIVGIAAGWLAGIITGTQRRMIGNLALGLIGALIAGWITSNRVGGDAGLIVSIIIAAITAAMIVFMRNALTGQGR